MRLVALSVSQLASLVQDAEDAFHELVTRLGTASPWPNRSTWMATYILDTLDARRERQPIPFVAAGEGRETSGVSARWLDQVEPSAAGAPDDVEPFPGYGHAV